MSRVLVTGASGFVGRQLVAALEARGDAVVTYSSRHGDLAQLEPAYTDVRHVYHLAGKTYVPESWKNPRAFYQTNVLGTVNVLEYCRKQGASVTLLSSYVYGTPQTLPIREDHPLRASNPYGSSKIIAEEIAEFYRSSYNVAVNIVRAFNLYGPGQPPHFLIPTLITQTLDATSDCVVVEDDEPRRDYLFIQDLMELLLLLDHSSVGIYNAGSGRSFSVREIAALIEKIIGSGKPLFSRKRRRPDEIMDTVADISRARDILGWSPRTTMEAGLRLTIESIRGARVGSSLVGQPE